MVNYECAFSQSEKGKYFEWIINSYQYFSERNKTNNKRLAKQSSYNKFCRLMESSSEKVGLRLAVFLLTLPNMPLVWPLTRLAFCVWFEVKWNFYCRRCAVICPTPETFLTIGRVTNFSGSITKDKFPQLLPIFYIRYNFIKVLQIFSLQKIEAVYQFYPWNQITLPSLPPANPLPLLLACEQALCLGRRVKKWQGEWNGESMWTNLWVLWGRRSTAPAVHQTDASSY